MTGVQTCALPISAPRLSFAEEKSVMRAAALGCLMAVGCALTAARAADIPTRPPGLRAPDYATAQIATADLGHGVYMLSGAAVNATVAMEATEEVTITERMNRDFMPRTL